MPPFIIELNEHNLQQTLETSLHTPVLIYFWADLVPESVTMKKVVENLVTPHQGALILALVDCKEQRQLAGQFGVQAIPTIAIFQDGQAVDGLAGEQSEQTIKEMLEKYLPDPTLIKLQQAQQFITEDKNDEALALLLTLKNDLADLADYQLTIAQCTINLKQFDEAKNWLHKVRLQDQDSRYKALIAAIELHQQAANTPEIQALQMNHQADPDNLAISYNLAVALNQVNKQEQALQLLITILTKDLNFEEGNAKKTMLDILATLGQGNSIAGQYRRQLYALLY